MPRLSVLRLLCIAQWGSPVVQTKRKTMKSRGKLSDGFLPVGCYESFIPKSEEAECRFLEARWDEAKTLFVSTWAHINSFWMCSCIKLPFFFKNRNNEVWDRNDSSSAIRKFISGSWLCTLYSICAYPLLVLRFMWECYEACELPNGNPFAVLRG